LRQQGVEIIDPDFPAQPLQRGAGAVDVRATRSSCGEALRCSPEQAGFAVTVRSGAGTSSAAVPKAMSSRRT